MTEEIQTIVIDNGSNTMKVGFGGAEEPRFVIPSVYGLIRRIVPSKTHKRKHSGYIGDKALANLSNASTFPLFERGVVRSWDKMEKAYRYIFHHKLHVDTAEHPVLLTDALNNKKTDREKMEQLIFETFHVPSFYIAQQTYLSLFSSGNNTGAVVDVGESLTQIAPYYEFNAIPKGNMKFDFGGRDLNNQLSDFIDLGRYVSNTQIKKKILDDIKEKHCYTALDYDAEFERAKHSNECDVSYDIPNGRRINIDKERFMVPELLFRDWHYHEFLGIPIYLSRSIFLSRSIVNQCDLYNNIVLSGGSTMFEDFPERFHKETVDAAPESMKIHIVAPHNVNMLLGSEVLSLQALRFSHKRLSPVMNTTKKESKLSTVSANKPER